ncbi:MAG: helix-turn-helix transcriptional regulator [Lentisphaeria bacterium]|nr:helix-turn-helix transcriptional regulator [Lentisphaeria bacterium]
MIHAYSENYLDDAMQNLGEAFDFAYAVCHLDLDNFFAMFINSGVAELFGSGHPKYVAGLSGTELAMEVMRKSGLAVDDLQAQIEYDCSPEYWSGWALAYFQWFTKRPFKNIAECVTISEILELYPALHEASEEKFVETLNRMIRNKNLPTRLQKRRKDARLTQKELAARSGVKLRTIQQYEMRAKNINKAAAETLQQLAQVLLCSIEELLEYEC